MHANDLDDLRSQLKSLKNAVLTANSAIEQLKNEESSKNSIHRSELTRFDEKLRLLQSTHESHSSEISNKISNLDLALRQTQHQMNVLDGKMETSTNLPQDIRKLSLNYKEISENLKDLESSFLKAKKEWQQILSGSHGSMRSSEMEYTAGSNTFTSSSSPLQVENDEYPVEETRSKGTF